ncbi:MAG: RraA family protein [Candidatus Latescibacteria bacterium]|jgi:4-hydroxy-4-methyl-2-oxoglutarate aldolase|nr:RraA family protein [Candidatus Latescibacterota bacterium]
MKVKVVLLAVCFTCIICIVFSSVNTFAQIGTYSKEELIKYTPHWKGERFPDGRPKVPEEIIERMKKVALEEAWAVCRRYGYFSQYEGDWVMSQDDAVLVGRAVTVGFMPMRTGVNEIIEAEGKKDGRIGGQNSWVIDTLVDGDVPVVDMLGRVRYGCFFGGNLAHAIRAKTGTGIVVDGGNRDMEDVIQMENFPVFSRGWDPGYPREEKKVMLMGLNSPTRIGEATVMPGDVVLAKSEGIIFIPPHLAEEIVKTSEVVRLRDAFGYERLTAGVYTPGQIDTRWSDELEKDFAQWLKKRGEKMTAEEIKEFLRTRTW